MNALLVISRAFLFHQNRSFAAPQHVPPVGENVKAVFKILYHEQRTHFKIYRASLPPF